MEEYELLRKVLTEEEFDVDLSSNSEDENSVRALDLLVSSPESVVNVYFAHVQLQLYNLTSEL
jgi:hypothetical protein